MPNPHDKLLAAAAKEILSPLGFRRKGRSRVWIKDQDWWLNVVEFQPSSWAKGSYLNVAAHWLWIEQDYLSFDYGGRVEVFSKYLSDEQFGPEAFRLAESAAFEANRISHTFCSVEDVATVLLAKEGECSERARGGWSAYHAAMAAALSGRVAEATVLFQSVKDERIWPAVSRVNKFLARPIDFKRETEKLITAHRRTLGLTPAFFDVEKLVRARTPPVV